MKAINLLPTLGCFCVFLLPATANAAAHQPLAISVRNTSDLSGLRPVTGGAPLPEGAVPEGSGFTLREAGGETQPCQTFVLARWKDGSARWVLLDFQSDPPPGGVKEYLLSWSGRAEQARPGVPVEFGAKGPTFVRSGQVSLEPTRNGLLRLYDRFDIGLYLTDENGERCEAVVVSEPEVTGGPLRGTLSLEGAFRDSHGDPTLSFRMRVSVFAGLSRVFVEPLLLVDPAEGVIKKIRDLYLQVTPVEGMNRAAIGGQPDWRGAPDSNVRLFQVDDTQFRFEGAEETGPKAPGWAEISDGSGSLAVALRDFWQQWPKSLEVDKERLRIGLFPSFQEGDFAHIEPWYKHQYLFEGDCYRLRTGQARRWQIWLDLSGEGPSLATAANAPLVPSVSPEQAIATGVWGPVAAAGTPGMGEYDNWADNLFENGYCRSIEEQRDYGAMNWGDWWGERDCNWGNHEYDTPKHLLVQFARTGNPKYFYVGDTAARHTSEVDVIHYVNEDLRKYFEETLGGNPDYPTRPGMVHEHCVGHVSGFYSVEKIRDLYVSLGIGKTDSPYLCLDPYNLGHIWTQGMVYDYFLTGDPWLKETVLTIGENLAKLVEDREYTYFKGTSHSGRVNGWTMLALAGAYELDPSNEGYLHAMKLLADDALSEQDPNCGGWLYELPWGHCFCETKKHVGEAGFITAVRLNGLSRYYELTGDERIPESVRRGVTHLNNDTWQEQYSGWRYTSCPASSSGLNSQPGVTIMALVNAVTLSGDEEHLRILKKAWEAKFERLKVAPDPTPGLGKTYSTTMYGCPEAMNLFVNGASE